MGKRATVSELSFRLLNLQKGIINTVHVWYILYAEDDGIFLPAAP